MDAKIFDQVTASTVGNCNMMITEVNMQNHQTYTISNIPFIPKVLMCAQDRTGNEMSTIIIKPMLANQIMQVTAWEIDFIVIKTSWGGDWHFVILG